MKKCVLALSVLTILSSAHQAHAWSWKSITGAVVLVVAAGCVYKYYAQKKEKTKKALDDADVSQDAMINQR